MSHLSCAGLNVLLQPGIMHWHYLTSYMCREGTLMFCYVAFACDHGHVILGYFDFCRLIMLKLDEKFTLWYFLIPEMSSGCISVDDVQY